MNIAESKYPRQLLQQLSRQLKDWYIQEISSAGVKAWDQMNM